MRRRDPRRGRAARPTVAILALSLMLMGAGPARKKRSDGPPPKADETVSDLAYIVSTGETQVEGVGLVVGLDGTGSEAPPSYYRTKLLDEMRKAGIEDANKILNDKNASIVIVRLKVPTGVSTVDRLDVELELPPASGTTSLAGGYLMPTRLREVLVAGGSAKEGPEFALAQGPVMTGSEAKPDSLKDGRVLGGGRCKKDIPFSLVLKDSRKSIRTSAMLQKVVNERFHQTEGKDQKEMATAKTDQFLVLQVPRVYHQNQPRYFRVIKLLSMVDNPTLRAQRMERWSKELLDPKTSGLAALRLEGLGPSAIESLKGGLANSHPHVRYFAAEALAYLGDPSGIEALGEAAKDPDLRAVALTAMAAMDQPAAHLKLRKLMDEADVELRYGAFNALRTLDERDPFLGQVRVLEDEAPPEETDSMAVALRGASRRQPRATDPFSLYIVDSEGPPLIHLARTRRCEIVVFGRYQRMLTPIVLGTGPILLNASDGDESLEISRIVPGAPGDSDAKVAASLDVGDVIRQTANLGATYPQIVEILSAASRQKNLPGPLVVDAVPTASPEYDALQITGRSLKPKEDSKVAKAKNESPKRTGLLERLRNRFSR